VSLLVGLTGGIGSGKSLAASFFKDLGAYIIDADRLCRDLVQPGQAALQEIINNFGVAILDCNGNLDRKKLAYIIFNNSEQKSVLEGILHPKVFKMEQEQYLNICSTDASALVIIDATLLIESGNYKHVDQVVVIRSSRDLQVQRLLIRESFTLEEITARVNNQMSLEEKIKYADFILDNNSNKDDLKDKVIELHSKLSMIVNNKLIQ
jgi:dephospho-CoA kinase